MFAVFSLKCGQIAPQGVFVLPVVRNMQSPSHLLRYEYSLPFVISFWLLSIGCLRMKLLNRIVLNEDSQSTSMSSGDEMVTIARIPPHPA